MKTSEKRENNLSHLAIIMDGNGRWSEQKGLPREDGHKEGVKSLRKLLRYIDDLELEKKDEAELKGQSYEFILDKSYRWSKWAMPKNPDGTLNHHEALAGDDLVDFVNGKLFPSWLQVKQSGTKALVGYFVAHNGSARPISEIFFHNGIIDFSIPPQFDGYNDMHFKGVISKGILKGFILISERGSHSFSGLQDQTRT